MQGAATAVARAVAYAAVCGCLLVSVPAVAGPPGMDGLPAGTFTDAVEARERGGHVPASGQKCDDGVDDPRCALFAERANAAAARALERDRRRLYGGDVEYCEAYPREEGCRAVLREDERRHRQRMDRELKALCREQPDAERCTGNGK